MPPIPFPYERRQEDSAVDPEEALRQGRLLQRQNYPTDIAVDNAPAPEPSPALSTPLVNDEPPAIDPQVMAALRAPANDPDSLQNTPPTTGSTTVVSAPDTSLTRSRRVETDERGRPIANAAMTPGAIDPSTGEARINPATGRPYTRMDQLQDASKRLGAYVPRKASGWWNRYAKPALMGWSLAQSKSLNPGAGLGGALGGIVGTAINPTAQDDRWKTNELGEVQSQIDQEQETEKARLATQKTKAEIAKLNSPPVRAPRALHIETDRDGYLRTVDTTTGVSDFVRDKDGNRVQGNKAIHYDHEFDEVTGRTYITEDGKRTDKLSIPPLFNEPGIGWMPPGQKAGAVAVAGRQLEAEITRVKIENQRAAQENARIDASIKQWEEERDGLDRVLKETDKDGNPLIPPTVTKTDVDKNRYEAPNSIYTDKMDRRRTVNDKIIGAQNSKRPILTVPTAKPAATTGSYTEQQVRDRWKATPANKRVHKSADEAVTAAKASGLIPK